jgi:hypothetical protein
MQVEAGDLVAGAMMLVFGLIGIMLASGATDNEMYVFGLSLIGFAAVFVFGLIKRHYDKAEMHARGEDWHV